MSFMVGTLFAYLNYRSTTRRVVFMAVSLVVPVVANWLRAYMIVMLGHLSGNKLAAGVDHLIYGWVFFGVVIIVLYMIGARWAEPDVVPAAAPAGSSVDNVPGGTSAAFAAALLACVALIALPPLASAALQRGDSAATPPPLALPGSLGDWQSEGAQLTVWRPSFVNPSVEVQRAYALGGQTVGVFIAYYRQQGPERKLVSSENVLVTSKDKLWNHVASGSLALRTADQTLTVRTAELLGTPAPGSAHRPKLVVWRSYWVNGTWVAGDAAAKLRGAFAQLRGLGDDSALVLLYADADTSAESKAALTAFAQANLGTLEALLRQARDAR